VLRVTINVPQNAAVGVGPGIEAEVKVPQMPGRSFPGKIERSSVALLASSRTLVAQVDVSNGDRTLRPGLFAYVTLQIPRTATTIAVPAEAMVFNQRGTQVLVAETDGTAHWRSIRIERDKGTTVEVSQGLNGTERLVLSPPPDLQDGARIEAYPNPEPGKPVQAANR